MIDVDPKTLSPKEYEHYGIRFGDRLPEFIPVENLWLEGYIEDAAGATWVFVDTASIWGAEACAAQLVIDGKSIMLALRANLTGLVPPRGKADDVPVEDALVWFKNRDMANTAKWKGYGVKLPFKPEQLKLVDHV